MADYFDKEAEKITDVAELQRLMAHARRAGSAEGRDIEDVLCPALGYHYTYEYGWDIGDHVPVSLAMQAAGELRNYRKLLRELRAIHFPRGQYCNECGGKYPCATMSAVKRLNPETT